MEPNASSMRERCRRTDRHRQDRATGRMVLTHEVSLIRHSHNQTHLTTQRMSRHRRPKTEIELPWLQQPRGRPLFISPKRAGPSPADCTGTQRAPPRPRGTITARTNAEKAMPTSCSVRTENDRYPISWRTVRVPPRPYDQCGGPRRLHANLRARADAPKPAPPAQRGAKADDPAASIRSLPQPARTP